MNLTTQQLAEILIGVARSQQAIIDAVDSQKAGFKGTYMAPALEGAAKIRSTGRAPTLQEFPARVLLQCQGRGGPNVEQMVKDLEALLSGQAATPSAIAPATARAAAAAPQTPAAAPTPTPVAASRPPVAASTPAPAAVPRPPAAAPAAPAASDNDLDMTR